MDTWDWCHEWLERYGVGNCGVLFASHSCYMPQTFAPIPDQQQESVMPITQLRLARTLEAGETVLKHYKRLREMINHICAQQIAGKMTTEGALAAIAGELTVAPPYLPAESVLIEERTRYQYTYVRNFAEKERMRRRRLEAGIPTKTRLPAPPRPDETPDTELLHRVETTNTAEDAAIDSWLSGTNDSENIDEQMTEEEKAEMEKLIAWNKQRRGE